MTAWFVLACLLACFLACFLACLLACLLVRLLACLLACLLPCWLVCLLALRSSACSLARVACLHDFGVLCYALFLSRLASFGSICQPWGSWPSRETEPFFFRALRFPGAFWASAEHVKRVQFHVVWWTFLQLTAASGFDPAPCSSFRFRGVEERLTRMQSLRAPEPSHSSSRA